jgi:hypothetical protein
MGSEEKSTVIICTIEELERMAKNKEIDENGYILHLRDLFEVLCDYYGVDPYWTPNDVY